MQKFPNLTQEYIRAHIKPTSDICARYLLSSPKNTNITKAFINAVLEDAEEPLITSVEILSPFNLRETVFAKETIIDVKVSNEKKSKYDIEIQTTTSDAFWNRMMYYNNSLFNNQISSSQKYETIKPTVVIALLTDHIYDKQTAVKPHDKMHHFSYTVHEDCHDDPFFPNGDPEKYHVIELDRFANDENALYTVREGVQRKLRASLFHWLRFMLYGAEEDFMEAYNETDTVVREAKKDYEAFISDEQMRDEQLRHEMWLHDQAQAKSDAEKEGLEKGFAKGLEQGIEKGLEQGIEKGLEQGREQGREQSREEIARKLKSTGIALTVISSCTGLSIEEIEKLQ